MRNSGKEIKIIVKNLTICYNDEGPDQSPVIIFIHGFPFNRSMWHFQTEALKENYRVIAYDIRGFGNSDTGDEDFSIELFVYDLLNLMDALKIGKAMLCGLSMGGYIALNAIVRFPERFSALILCDTHCIADSPEAKETRLKNIENIREKGIEKYAGDTLKKLFAEESFTTNTKGIAAVEEMILKTKIQSLYLTLHGLSERKETCSRLSEITVPVLILVGKEDIITPPDAARFMHGKIKQSVLHIIDRAGHVSNIENPGEFNTQLIRFVSSVSSAV